MGETKLSVIVPVYNEEKTILEIIRSVKAEAHKKEILSASLRRRILK